MTLQTSEAAQSQVRCGTRALKNARFLRERAPELISEDDTGADIPLAVLGRLHNLSPESAEVANYERLRTVLRQNPVPGPQSRAQGPLFNGTIHFVQVTFQIPSRTLAISMPDMDTIVHYAQAAIRPINEYAAQYGTANASIAPAVLTYSVTLARASYNDAAVQQWANAIAHQNSLPATDAVAIPSPQGLTARAVSGNAGYHGLANLPYTVFGVFAQNLTLQDRPDVYAMVVSHEIAELVVDPKINHTNPEVCDPCDLNCGPLHRAYFDAQNAYLGTTPALPPPFAFDHYICAIVKPAAAADCPAPAATCNYAPAA